jgi:hypothetical protein
MAEHGMAGWKRLAVALAFSIAGGPAWAQGETEIMQAVGKQLDAYTLCLRMQAHDLGAQSQDSEDVIIDKALVACDAERQDLWEHLQAPPLNAKADTATKAVKQLTAAMWPSMISIIEAARVK